MKNDTPRKSINVDKPNRQTIYEFKELDNAILRLSLYKNSIPFDIDGQNIKLGAKTSDGIIEQVDGFTINANELDIELKNSILVPGTVEIDLELKDANGIMTTASFFINVESRVLNNSAVQATNEFDTFTKTVEKIEEDYTGLRRIIIDENQAANLQDQVNKTNEQLEQIENKKIDGLDIRIFGVVGDGVADDTQSIQKAIEFIHNNVKNNGLHKVSTLLFNSLRCKITSTINCSQYVKLKSIGYTVFESYVENGACIHITPRVDDFDNLIGNKQDWFRGKILNGESGILIKYFGSNNVNSIGLEIGSKTNLGIYKTISKCCMADFRVQGFGIGIKVNPYNVYMTSFERVYIETNKVNVQYGDENNTVVSNSGERMNFTDCILAGSDIAVKWYCDGMDTYFNNCSLDYNKCLFYDVNNRGYRHIVVSNGHIEAIGSDDLSNPYGLIYGDMKRSKIIFENNPIMLKHQHKQFVKKDIDLTYDLTLKDNKFVYMIQSFDGTLPFLADESLVSVYYEGNNFSTDAIGKFFNNNLNLLPSTSFKNVDLGVIDLSTARTIGDFTIKDTTNVNLTTTSSCEIISDSPIAERALKITPKEQGSSFAFFLETSDFIPVQSNKTVALNAIGKNVGNTYPILVYFYDYNKNQIGVSDNIHTAPLKSDENWYMSPYMKRVKIPRNCYFIKVRYQFSFKATSNYGCVGGMFAQYE